MAATSEPAAVPAPAPKPATDRTSMTLSWAMTLVFDIGVTLLAFHLAESAGWSDQFAYLISAIGPLISMVITWIRTKTLTGFSVIILVLLVTSSVATMVGGTDPRLLIVKDSVVTGIFGMVILVSRLFPKPLMFYMGSKFATDGSKAGVAWWYSLWQFPDFRASQYRINYAWAVLFLVEAGAKIAIAYSVSSFQLANTVTQFLPLVALVLAIAFTMRESARTRRAAIERIAGARSQDAGSPDGTVGRSQA